MTLLIGMILILVALAHLVLEVHGRYHAYLVPLLWLLAAAAFDRLPIGVLTPRRPTADGPLLT